MINRRTILMAGGAAGIAAGPALADETTGVTPTTIKIGILGSLTGPASFWGSGNLAGNTLRFEEINAAGGIHGRRLEIVSVDDETSPPKGITGFRRLVDQDKVFAIIGPTSSAVGVPLLRTIQRSDVPVFISIFSSPVMTEPMVRNIFRACTLNDRIQGVALADYALTISPNKKIAIIRQSDEYGQRGATSFTDRLKEKGVTPVAHEVFNAADSDFTAQLLRIRDTSPDMLLVYSYPAPSAIAIRQARQLNLQAQIVGSTASSSRNYPQTVGAAAVGTRHGYTAQVLIESGDPKMVAFRHAYEQRFPDLARQARPDVSDLGAYGGADVFAEGLRRAGRELTRSGFMRAMETLSNYDNGLTAPATITPEDHEGSKMARIVEIQPDLSRKILPVVLSVGA